MCKHHGNRHSRGRLENFKDYGYSANQAGSDPRLLGRDARRRGDRGSVALGDPLSTTHTIGTAIMGVGSIQRFSAVRWGLAGEIVMAWVLTFPICGLIAYLVTHLINFFS